MTFEEVYARFRDPVWRLARRLGGEDAALDATQEIFLRVWRGLPGFRGEAKLSTWVFQIAWNYLRMARRRANRARLVVVPGADDAEIVERVPDPGPDPERRAGARVLLGRVEAALESLPEHYQITLWLRDGEGLSYDEIATVLDIPVGTVRSRLARARAALKEAIEP